MKPRIGYLFWILVLAFSLMIVVLAIQLLTKKNINGSKKGDQEAVITFNINNKLTDLVNLCFELQTKVTNANDLNNARQSLTDSLTMLGYNASILEQINLNEQVSTSFKKLNKDITRQIETSLEVLNNKGSNRLRKIDTLRKLEIGDSVYATALSIQKYLEKDLQTTFKNNRESSSRLTDYNRTLAIIAIAAVLILGTIIINRHLRQVQLISELEKATDAAKKSAMIKDQFLSNMSHEIRTPLNAIKGFSHLITQTKLSKEQQQYAEIINNASGSLIHIVNDILDISKIEAGKLRIEAKQFDLSKLLQTTEYLFLNAAAEKKLEYSQYINETVPVNLKDDPERLSQILINLISNGIKFTPTGYVHTIVSISKEVGNQIWIKFVVEDSGVGIPSNKQEKIFQRFEQLDINNSKAIEGTGLGLSIVKNLVVLMGGEISVLSEYGKGSVFNVELPFIKVDKPIDETTESNKTAVTSYSYAGSSVLVVEDNKVNQLLIKHILTDLNIISEIVSNGQEALNILERRSFDLVLMDIQMPVLDGYATVKVMRKNSALQIPVIAMTAYAMPGEKEKCFTAGMNGYIAKPVDSIELAKLLGDFLKPITQEVMRKDLQKEVKEKFLLELAGGDSSIAKLILKQIKTEIPHTIKKLKQFKSSNYIAELKSICHHMVSTFSPMGSETPVMKKIQQLQHAEVYEGRYRDEVGELEKLLHKLETSIDQSIESIN